MIDRGAIIAQGGSDMSFLQEIDMSFLTEKFIDDFERAQREDRLVAEVHTWLRNGAEPEPDRPIWYELELEQCYEDIEDWLRSAFRSPQK
jgi:hypothetical protein